jgi:hypothetical protein
MVTSVPWQLRSSETRADWLGEVTQTAQDTSDAEADREPAPEQRTTPVR